MADFNSGQKKAVAHKAGPALIIAGPGSGKTFVTTNRIAGLVNGSGVRPENILALTFTRAAAGEMEERYLRLCGREGRGVIFGTFHSVFLKHLREYPGFSGLVFCEGREALALLKAVYCSMFPEPYPSESCLVLIKGDISRMKNSLPARYGITGKVYTAYNRALHEKGLIDYDDMLLLFLKLLKKDYAFLKKMRGLYKYILLDEFQDINCIQFAVIKLLSGESGNVFAVGDDDQSIYAFRGSEPGIMLSFSDYFRGADIINLDINYRSGRKIVDSASRLIRKNKKRYRKNLKAEGGKESYIEVKGFDSEIDEAGYILKSVLSDDCGLSMAVLYRTHRAGGRIKSLLLGKMEFMERNVTFTTFHGSKGMEFDEVYIINANEKFTPGRPAGGEELSEERRMFYVAMTRARYKLHIFYTKPTYNNHSGRSRFIQECGILL